MLTMVNPIDYGGHSSKVKVTIVINDKCGVRGDATLCVVIFYYGIEQHITLTLPTWCCLFTVRYYMTLFNTFALRAGRWCSGMSIASYGVLLWFETYTPLCSIRYFFYRWLFCTFCSLFHTLANISIFLLHWHCHINFYFPFSQFMCRCKDWNAWKNLVIIFVPCY